MITLRKVYRLKNTLLRKAYELYKVQGQQRALKFYRKVQQKKYGLNLVGYFSYTSGVAEVGRFFSKRLKESNVPFLIYDIAASNYKKLDELSLAEYKSHFAGKTVFYKNIFFVNGDAIDGLMNQSPELFIGRHNVGVFFWEFDDYFYFPNAFNAVNEVIAFTDFIATAVRKAAPPAVKVTKLNFPFVKNWEITKPAGEIRSHLGIFEDEFVFIFNFDFHSVYDRKNPEAILKAFTLAFTATDKVRLILKSIHAEENSTNFSKFQTVINNMPFKEKVIIINENLDRNEFMSMIQASDAYISLHRSEGLGLGMMEAMSMGKPVIATRYGGNLDFMNDENSCLVNYKLVPVEPGAGPYQPGWLWADADIEEASVFMKKLYEDRAYCKSLGDRAQEYILSYYNEDRFMKELTTWMRSS